MDVADFLAADAMARELGITAEQTEPGRATARVLIGEELTNGHATAHGAAIFAVADIAFALACNSRGPAIGRSCSIEYLMTAAAGDELVATATERALEGRTGIYDVAVRRASDGVLVAEMRALSRLLAAASPPAPPAAPPAARSRG